MISEKKLVKLLKVFDLCKVRYEILGEVLRIYGDDGAGNETSIFIFIEDPT